jgi:hypothetical protein
MRFHYGLGVGHVYSHEARTCLTQDAPHPVPHTATQAEIERSEREESPRETINWQPPADNDDEEDEEDDHVGVEELNLFEQERNGSTESLVEALDEMFNHHVFDYEN